MAASSGRFPCRPSKRCAPVSDSRPRRVSRADQDFLNLCGCPLSFECAGFGAAFFAWPAGCRGRSFQSSDRKRFPHPPCICLNWGGVLVLLGVLVMQRFRIQKSGKGIFYGLSVGTHRGAGCAIAQRAAHEGADRRRWFRWGGPGDLFAAVRKTVQTWLIYVIVVLVSWGVLGIFQKVASSYMSAESMLIC